MKSKMGCLLILGALPLVVYPFVLLANIMAFAAPWSGNVSLVLVLLSYTFYIATTVYPLVYLFCVASAIIAARKQNNRALGFAFAPIGYLLFLVGLSAIWSFAETNISTLQEQIEQARTSHVAKCAPSALVDGGDGLRTTGCGVLEIGKPSSGVIADTVEAHNWEFQVTSLDRMMITITNDKKSCPDIRILDSGGKPATGFEHESPRCYDGLLSGSNHYFTPSGNGTYFIRVFTPKTPGKYSLYIQPYPGKSPTFVPPTLQR
jgi:hypothetical protein